MENATPVAPTAKRAPVLAMWICMVIAWVALAAPILYSVVVGAPLAIVALVLAIKCLRRGRKSQGVLGCVGSTVGSVIAYIIGWSIFGVMAFGEMRDDYIKKAAEAETAVLSATSVPHVSAAAVLADFAADHNAALAKYENQVVDVTGIVRKSGVDVMKNPYLSLAASADGNDTMDCVFSADPNIDLSRFTIGEEATIRGRVDWFVTVRMLSAKIVE